MLWLHRRRYGRVLEPVNLWARMPEAFIAMSRLYRALDRGSSPLEPQLRSLVQVRVSQINACDFCQDMNSGLAFTRGIAEDRLRALPQFRTSALFNEREKAALQYAEAVTCTGHRLENALLRRLHTHFDDQAIVELAALIAFQNMSSKFNVALGVAAHGFCATATQSPANATNTE